MDGVAKEMKMRGISRMFLQAMRDKLDEGRAKGRTEWDRGKWTVSAEWLLERLRDEVAELADALRSGHPIEIRHEAADVALFAMFLAEYCSGPKALGAYVAGGIPALAAHTAHKG